ncbi:MAG: M23 family metallopeptidase [Gammaproteobacteria bacterium]|nr:M23 family metallopeptidase [Gammaproteobacteria bacterium]
MTLEIGSKNRVLAALKGRGVQIVVIGVLAVTWWRGEEWLTDLTRADESTVAAQKLVSAEAARAALGLATVEVMVGAGDTLERIFRKLKLSLTDLAQLRSLPDLRAKLDRLKPGEMLRFGVKDDELVTLERQLSPSETLSVQRDDSGFATEVIVNPLERELRSTEATIRSSLFQAAADAGLSDNTALRIANIFQWDIDFVLDIQPGDRFRVTYEKVSQDGEPLGEGDILAVEFVNRGKPYRAIRFQPAGAEPTYFTPDGKSLRKAFLRAPLEFSRVSSRFNLYRRHPVLNRIRAHRGVDYAAPIGTPVRAAGSGRVRFVGNKGGYGKVVELEHVNQVRTVYGHLSRFARGLSSGDRISQGEIIGYVGMTGLATGPHLHYEYLSRGVHMDPQKVALPTDIPVPPAQMARFREAAAPLLVSLATGDVSALVAAQVPVETPNPATAATKGAL